MPALCQVYACVCVLSSTTGTARVCSCASTCMRARSKPDLGFKLAPAAPVAVPLAPAVPVNYSLFSIQFAFRIPARRADLASTHQLFVTTVHAHICELRTVLQDLTCLHMCRLSSTTWIVSSSTGTESTARQKRTQLQVSPNNLPLSHYLTTCA